MCPRSIDTIKIVNQSKKPDVKIKTELGKPTNLLDRGPYKYILFSSSIT